MWRHLLIVATVASLACSSTLEEYRCATDDDCQASNQSVKAQCENSGHCSFADSTCGEDGYRYGEASGSESGSCVEGQVPPDAGLDATSYDASPAANETPVAAFSTSDYGPCGTSLLATTMESEAFDGASIEEYKWTILGADDQVIYTSSGVANEPVPHGLHVLGGTYDRPRLNFPTYHGALGLHGTVNASTRTTIYQTDILVAVPPSGTNSFRLSFASASFSAVDRDVHVGLGVVLESGLVLGVYTQTFSQMGGGVLAGHETEFSFGEVFSVGGFSEFIIAFQFDGIGGRYLDNVALVETSMGTNVVASPSVEPEGVGPWLFGDSGMPQNGLTQIETPTQLLETEDYTLQLQVTDSNDLESNVAEFNVIGACM